MGNLNKVLLMGRLTRDPELRYTPQGVPVTDIPLAVNREFKGQDGERRKDTVFVDVTFWRRRAEILCQYLKKGQPLYLEGRLSLDNWETQDGQKRSKLRVVGDDFQFIGSRSDAGGGDGGGGGGGGGGGDGDGESGAPAAGGSSGGYTSYEYPSQNSGGSVSGGSVSGGSVSGGGGSGGSVSEEEAVDDSEVPF
ncbi:MAG: single-stranded DNA-binding protein [Planctomycetota bacterium]|nr:single-stranded DNA-binding protein [Planctomycetota bacterium]